jgi:hypothetical protein
LSKEWEHDPLGCGIDPATDCPECRPRTIRARQLQEVRDTLWVLGITIEDLAEMLFFSLEPWLQQRFDEMAERMIEAKLRTLGFSWQFNGRGKEVQGPRTVTFRCSVCEIIREDEGLFKEVWAAAKKEGWKASKDESGEWFRKCPECAKMKDRVP